MSRYSRQEILPEVGAHGQAVLAGAHLTLIGLGGLGSAAAPYLAGAGIGRLTLVDGDRVELSNLQRQPLYDENAIGQFKAHAAARRLAALNSEIELAPVAERVDARALAALAADCDLMLDCSDNFPTRHAINRACLHHRRPLVSGAAIRLEGQLLVTTPGRGEAPCYACLYAEAGAAAEACEDAGVLGPLVGAVGALQALEAIRLLLGLARPGVLHRYDARRAEWRKWQVRRDSGCAVCGPSNISAPR